jgi:hypothetical protein
LLELDFDRLADDEGSFEDRTLAERAGPVNGSGAELLLYPPLPLR